MFVRFDPCRDFEPLSQPFGLDAECTEATYCDGVLTLTIPVGGQTRRAHFPARAA